MNNPTQRKTQAIFGLVTALLLLAVAIYLPYSVLESSIVRVDYYMFISLAAFISVASFTWLVVSTRYFKSIAKRKWEVKPTVLKRGPWLVLMVATCMISS